MGVRIATFLFTALLVIAWPFAVQAKMFADCTFGKINTTEGQKMTAKFTAKLAAFKHISHSCFVETDGQNHQNHFLQVRAKRNKESKGFLHVSVYGTDESRILGHLDVSTSEADWSSLIVCPSRYSNEVQDKHLIFSGSPNLSFTVQIDSSPRRIKLNEPQTVRVTPENVQVFQFLPPEDIAKTQLDVTVTSESGDVPAYLKVSRVCKDVEKDNIDEVDYKGESIRLSFAKKGRITLSKVSVPPLTDSTSSWFIGIAIKNATGETPFNAKKSVTLELNKSFDYSYGGTISLFVSLSIVAGLLISLAWAFCIQRLHQNTDKSQGTETELSRQGNQPQQSSSRRKPRASSPLVNKIKTIKPTHSYTAAIVGFMLMIGAGQFVFANWHLMKDEGDRDICYYNDFCYRVSQWHDIPFNLMISNLVYIIHGLILATFVYYWERKERLTKTNLSKPEEHVFSIGYAFAWAMIFEGLFSLVYHLCPSKLTFQFDTAFMFVIAGLIVISLYNGTAKDPVGAANFFLYFLVPLLIFNYLGAVRHSETGLPTLIEIFIFVALGFWLVGVFIWAGLKLFKADRDNGNNAVIMSIGFAVGFIVPIVFLICFNSNLSQAFLISCIAESVIAILTKFVAQCRRKRLECERYLVCGIIYVLLMLSLWSYAFYLFFEKGTTDKAETPEKSRNLNQDCITRGFFDDHDLWHILSSHALLMTVYLVMSMSRE